MRQSSKYILGGLCVLAAQTAFIAIFGWPQRMGHASPQAIGLFAAGVVCIGYGVSLRKVEATPFPRPKTLQRFGRKVPGSQGAPVTALNETVETVQEGAAKSWEKKIDWDKFKCFAINNLRPDILLVSLREHRHRHPGDGYCIITYDRFSVREAAEIGLSDFIRQANEDADIRAAIMRMNDYGFQVTINSYDEPSGRELHVGVKQNEEAELAMRMMERLD